MRAAAPLTIAAVLCVFGGTQGQAQEAVCGGDYECITEVPTARVTGLKPQPPDDGDVDTLARMLLAWIAAKTSIAVPEPPRIAIVPERQMRRLFNAAADPDQQPQADVPADQGARDAHQASGLLAFYLRATATVYLPETWRRGALRDQSILLHELVHHVQRFNKLVPACPGALERQAYELQATWLRERGVAEPYELIGTDEFTVLVLTACMPPDE